MKSGHDDKRMELTEHLGELRTRILRCIWYLALGAIISYQFFTPIYNFMYAPLHKELDALNDKRITVQRKVQLAKEHVHFDPANIPKPHNPPTYQDLVVRDEMITYMFTHPAAVTPNGEVFGSFHEMFMVRLQLSLIIGFILVIPLVIREIALFILPALTPQEQRPLKMLMPVSVVCLLIGMCIAYATMFFAMHWFLSYLDDFPNGATLLQNPASYVLFFVKMMAAFGLAFQLPVLLMAGAFVGMITSAGLTKHWRWGVVIAVLGGVLTPSNDVPSMLLMAIPLLCLYFGSIFLVKIIEHMKARDRAKPA